MSVPPGQTPTSPAAPTDPKTLNRERFELELEFVQALANPYYIRSLAAQNVLDQPAFVNYLKYLLYWKEKEYARFLHYPHALHHLELLQQPRFRADMKKDDIRDYLQQKQFDHWRTWRDPKYTNPPETTSTEATESADKQAPVT